MYKHGKPIYRFERRNFMAVLIILVLAVGATAFFISKNHKDSLKNDSQPLVSTVKASSVNTEVNEPAFTMTLPGQWKLASVDWDARYHAWQWENHDAKSAAGRWFRVYQDTIPADYAYNLVLPVGANGGSLDLGQASGNCADFTTTAQTSKNSTGTIAAVSKWQGVGFLCDYGNQNHQVVGTSSSSAINSVTLKGATGEHRFFFLYQDNNFDPDYGRIANILSTFRAK